jgi:hypothetical protein
MLVPSVDQQRVEGDGYLLFQGYIFTEIFAPLLIDVLLRPVFGNHAAESPDGLHLLIPEYVLLGFLSFLRREVVQHAFVFFLGRPCCAYLFELYNGGL